MSKIIAYYGNFGKYNTEEHIAQALEFFDIQVKRLHKDSKDLPKCDFRMFAKLNHNYVVKNSKQPTVCWLFDLYSKEKLPFNRSFNEPQFSANIVITTNGSDNYHTIKQAIHKPFKEKSLEFKTKKKNDVLFIGDPYSYRKKWLKNMNVPIVKSGYYGNKLSRLLSETKVILGDSYPTDYYWSNRVYVICGQGGFLIHPKVKGLYDHIPQFDQGEESQMIKFYLSNPDILENLRQNQYKLTPTYEDRCLELLNLLGNQYGL